MFIYINKKKFKIHIFDRVKNELVPEPKIMFQKRVLNIQHFGCVLFWLIFCSYFDNTICKNHL